MYYFNTITTSGVTVYTFINEGRPWTFPEYSLMSSVMLWNQYWGFYIRNTVEKRISDDMNSMNLPNVLLCLNVFSEGMFKIRLDTVYFRQTCLVSFFFSVPEQILICYVFYNAKSYVSVVCRCFVLWSLSYPSKTNQSADLWRHGAFAVDMRERGRAWG